MSARQLNDGEKQRPKVDRIQALKSFITGKNFCVDTAEYEEEINELKNQLATAQAKAKIAERLEQQLQETERRLNGWTSLLRSFLFNTFFHPLLVENYKHLIGGYLKQLVNDVDLLSNAECTGLSLPESESNVPILQMRESFPINDITRCSLWYFSLEASTVSVNLQLTGKVAVVKFKCDVTLTFSLDGVLLVLFHGLSSSPSSLGINKPQHRSVPSSFLTEVTLPDDHSCRALLRKNPQPGASPIGSVTLDATRMSTIANTPIPIRGGENGGDSWMQVAFLETPNYTCPLQCRVSMGNVPQPVQDKIRNALEKMVAQVLNARFVAPASIYYGLPNVIPAAPCAPSSTDVTLSKISQMLGTPPTKFGINKVFYGALGIGKDRVAPVLSATGTTGTKAEKLASAALIAGYIQLTMGSQNQDWSELMAAASIVVAENMADPTKCAELNFTAKSVLMASLPSSLLHNASDATASPQTSRSGIGNSSSTPKVENPRPSGSSSVITPPANGSLESTSISRKNGADNANNEDEEEGTAGAGATSSMAAPLFHQSSFHTSDLGPVSTEKVVDQLHRLLVRTPFGSFRQTSKAMKGSLSSKLCEILEIDQSATVELVKKTGILGDYPKAAGTATAALVMAYLQQMNISYETNAQARGINDYASQFISSSAMDADQSLALHTAAKELIVATMQKQRRLSVIGRTGPPG